MKQAKRVLALLLLAATLVSALAMTAYADTAESKVAVSVDIYNDFVSIESRLKQDSSPVYFYPQRCASLVGNLSPTTVYHVSVFGSTSSTGASGENRTLSNGSRKDYVTCRVGAQYSIYNDVYRTYAYAYLRIANGVETSNVPTGLEGVWSPDSDELYTPAT